MSEDADRWNHNVHYHPVIFKAVAKGCQRALDVGCGTGSLTRQLRHLLPHVTGIDLDRRSIELARCHPEAGDIEYLLGDFLAFPLEPESYDVITSVASLHHMDAVAALQRMRDLLSPGGVLAIIGLARGSSLFDLALNLPAVILTRVRQTASLAARPRAETYQSPIIWPPPETYQSMRRLAGQVLPGVRYRRHLLWRYSLVWAKPG